MGLSSERARTLSRRVHAPCSSAARSFTIRTARRAQLTGDLRPGRSTLTILRRGTPGSSRDCVRAPPQRRPPGLGPKAACVHPGRRRGSTAALSGRRARDAKSRPRPAPRTGRARGRRGVRRVFGEVFGECSARCSASVRVARRGVRQRVEALQRRYCAGGRDHERAHPPSLSCLIHPCVFH